MGVAIVVGAGWNLYRNVNLGLNADEKYDQYTQECDKFLVTAGTAGTTGLAKEELEKAVSWLKDNYSNESFEYRDLKSNLNYLKNKQVY